ncbi:MAG TPA: 50S ribosomal protein L21 [Solirubrobacteraceae bacterium]|jgi:large subunit ribosomal protein L21|nr:50S ribosomal protein L21 [Solirubrobacteraceae bacterium]
MYAIVKTGGKQYRVERGQTLLVERLRAEEGASVALEPLMYRSDETVLDDAGLAQVKVTAKVLAHVRGEKLRVFKFKPKRGYKRRTGHRQDLTRIEVTEITAGKAKAAKPAKADAGGTAAAEPKAPAKAKAAPKAKAPAKSKPAPKAKAAKPAKPKARGGEKPVGEENADGS